MYPALTRWQEDTTRGWRDGETSRTVLGRRFKPKLYTDACNLPVQGGSADVAKLAMHRTNKALKERGIEGVVQVNFIHDSFTFECLADPDSYKPTANILAESMQSAWQEVTQHLAIPDLPMPVKVVVGSNWGDLEDGSELPLYTVEV